MAEGNWNNPYTITALDVLGDGSIWCYRCGNLVYITCNAGNYTSQGMYNPLIYVDQNIEVPSLPVGYRPINTCQSADAYNKKRIVIDFNGVIMSSDTFSNTIVRFSAVWITTDPMPSA